ncbi:uncharacterized protein VP01_1192g5 [Puccinia sorghi]|uniref:Uncharacterized protein n=1 Tax=Puccinia sorghi TaxID=27349 RepID=A0A0L6VQU2_9BASI|nr:uncharacterized protein VP01_1192g5 [Puccinia sorghi]
MAIFLQKSQSPRKIPLTETPAQQRGPSLWFAKSTSQTRRTVGLEPTIWGIEDSLLTLPTSATLTFPLPPTDRPGLPYKLCKHMA